MRLGKKEDIFKGWQTTIMEAKERENWKRRRLRGMRCKVDIECIKTERIWEDYECCVVLYMKIEGGLRM